MLNPTEVENQDDIKWVKFWETSGSLPAELIAGRLKNEGIPSWAWQQGAGSAMGLTYGPMGRGYVMVPEDQVEAARKIMAAGLDEEFGDKFDDNLDLEELEDSDDGGWLSKGFLALTALAVSPLGVAAAFIIARLFGGQENDVPTCPDCELTFDLDKAEKSQGWFVCPECGRTVLLK